MLINVKSMIKGYKKRHERYPVCEGCRNEICEADTDDVEYIKTKRGDELFIHKGCVKSIWSI